MNGTSDIPWVTLSNSGSQKCVPWTSSISIIWEFVRNASSQAQPRIYSVRISGNGGLGNCLRISALKSDITVLKPDIDENHQEGLFSFLKEKSCIIDCAGPLLLCSDFL